VIVGVGKGREISRAEKEPYGIEDGRLTDIAAAENQIDAFGRVPREGRDAAEALDGQMVDDRSAQLAPINIAGVMV
jgi:hypothetical protein